MSINRTQAKELASEITKALQGVENALSPENLHCDGEISNAEANRKYAKLIREKKVLTKELGRTPTDAELYPGLGVK